MCIYFNPHVLEWNGIKFSSILLQSTSIHVDWDEYMRIQTRLHGAQLICSSSSEPIKYHLQCCRVGIYSIYIYLRLWFRGALIRSGKGFWIYKCVRKYNNGAKLVSIFANVEEREESFALIEAPSWVRKHICICGPKQYCMWRGVRKRK
jgi:hypothetical protein